MNIPIISSVINSNFNITEAKPDELHKIASVIVPTIMASMSHKNLQSGGIILAAGIGDALFAKHHNITNKHYLVRTLIFNDLVYNPWTSKLENLFSQHKLAIKALSFAMSGLISYYSDDFLDYSVKLGTSLKSFIIINKFFDKKGTLSLSTCNKIHKAFIDSPEIGINTLKETAVDLWQNKFIMNFAAVFIIEFVTNKIHRIFREKLGEYMYGGLVTTFLRKNEAELVDMTKLITKAIEILAIIKCQEIYLGIYNYIRSYLSNDLDIYFKNSYNNILLRGDNIEKILSKNNTEGEILLHNLENDIDTLKWCSDKLKYFPSEQIRLLDSINDIKSGSPDILLPYIISTLIKQKITIASTEIKAPFSILEKSLSTKYNSLKNAVIKNFREINVDNHGTGKNFLFNKLKFIATQQKDTYFKDLFIDQVSEFSKSVVNKFDDLLGIIYFAHNIRNHNNTSIENIYKISNAKDIVMTLFTSNSDAGLNNLHNMQSISRVEKIFEHINGNKVNAKHIYHDSDDIIFKNYSLYINTKLIVHIANLQINKGTYLLSGESGCGKSSTMMDLVFGVSPNLYSYGEMFLPKNANIMYLSKEIFKIPGETLLQIICYPKNLDDLSTQQKSELKEKVTYLLKKIEIDQFADDPAATEGIIKNLESVGVVNPSNGQMQKLGIARAIITNPDILIIDEGMNAMDEVKSLPKAQKLLKDYFKGTILVVDHGGAHHNFGKFFTGNIHFENNTVSYKKYEYEADLAGDVSSIYASQQDFSG